MIEELTKEVPELSELPNQELPLESVEKDSADEERSLNGKAYAVITDNGEFIFFRSTNEYTNKQKTDAIDLFGNKYSGTVFVVDESSEDVQNIPAHEAPWVTWWEDIKYNELVESVRVADKQAIKPKCMNMWFYDFRNMKSINLHGLDTSECTSMVDLFCRCYSLSDLDVSCLDTSKVVNMWNMFSGCSSLEYLDISSFDTSKVTNMNKMFDYCINLKTLNLGNIDTENVTDFTWCFAECKSLECLDISCLDTSNATDLSGLFAYCQNLTLCS